MNILHHPSICFTRKLCTLGLLVAHEARCFWPHALAALPVVICVAFPLLACHSPPEWGYYPQHVCRGVLPQRLQSALPVIRQRQPLHWRLQNGSGSVVARPGPPSDNAPTTDIFPFFYFPNAFHSHFDPSAGRRRGTANTSLLLPSLPPFTKTHTLTHTYTMPLPPSVPLRGGRQRWKRWSF